MGQSAPEPGEPLNSASRSVGLPVRPFLYTLDQISSLLMVDKNELKQHYIFYDGRSTGFPNRNLIVAHNIAPPDQSPEWRVVDKELVRWMRFKGFKYYDRASIRG
jgi:hypothetical protein